jgi:ferrous iron transport protein A
LDTIPLDCLQAGETGHIAWIDGQADFVTRLAEMGLRQGATIRMIQPGSPCILALHGQRLSIRVDGETQVFVELSQTGAVSV